MLGTVERGAELGRASSRSAGASAANAARSGAGVHPPPKPAGPVSRRRSRQPDLGGTGSRARMAQAPLPSAAQAGRRNEARGRPIRPGTGKDGRITKGDVLAFPGRRPGGGACPRPPRPSRRRRAPERASSGSR